MNMDNSWFPEWHEKIATPEEKRLYEKVYDFDSFFSDMLFQQESNTYKLIRCQSKQPGENVWEDDEIDLPDELSCFSYAFFHFKVEPLSNCGGYFDRQSQTLCIPPESLEDDKTILHELIHLHESVVNELPLYYHDMICWALYKDLKNKIPQLDEIVSDHAHLLTGASIYSNGGLHDILFLLKSFDLDIRKGYPLGTVFAYGRDKEFKDYSYVAE